MTVSDKGGTMATIISIPKCGLEAVAVAVDLMHSKYPIQMSCTI